jgi:hypothetical protein
MLESHLKNRSQPLTPLFSGVWIQWQALTQSERVVCAGILLTPLWWLWGWSYLQLLFTAGLLLYELKQTQKLELQRPSIVVVSMFIFGFYGLFSNYFYYQWNHLAINPRSLMSDIDTWIAPGIILWFIQSKNIRVRLNVVAWAFSILVGFMFLLWLWIYFIGNQGAYNPPQSLFGLLSGKSKLYVNGAGNSNYLIPYRPDDTSLPGLVRYVSFFHGPESFALVTSFVSLLALDLKNKKWSFILLGSTVALLLLSGTRSAWIAFTVVFCIRYLIKAGNTGGVTWLCAALAAATFTIFCIPPVTNLMLGTIHNTAQTTAELRADSTEVRAEIYRRTWDGISNSSEPKFWLGHVVEGDTVLPGYEPARVGTHSFYLGSLLYRQGIVGTIIFAVFWISWIRWLYLTKADRYLASFLIIIFLSLTFCVMAFESMIIPLLLISAVIHKDLSHSSLQQEPLHI